MRRVLVRRLLCALLLLVASLAACSSGDGGGDTPAVETTTPLRVADVPAAVAALEERLGGPQQYTEINTTTDGVNLFVATTPSTESPWFFRSGGGLEAPPADVAAAGTPFAVAGLDLSLGADLVLQVQRQLPGAVVLSCALVQVPDQGLVWALRSRSVRGGELDVLFAPDGRLLAGGPSAPG